jgi:hypothetical protein
MSFTNRLFIYLGAVTGALQSRTTWRVRWYVIHTCFRECFGKGRFL